MRRGIVLLSVGWGIMWIMFLNLFVQERKIDIPAFGQMPIAGETDAITFPYKVGDTNLLIEGLGIYDGPFLEDASDSPVTNIAALRIKNCSKYPVERGAVVLEIDKERYVFEVYAIPPGESVFVCELDKKIFTTQPVLSCTGWAVEDIWFDNKEKLSIIETDIDTLQITNISNQFLPCIQLLYKSYDNDSGVYIGGICYTLDIVSLQPGESKTVTPYRYVSGYSRIVTVKLSA